MWHIFDRAQRIIIIIIIINLQRTSRSWVWVRGEGNSFVPWVVGIAGTWANPYHPYTNNVICDTYKYMSPSFVYTFRRSYHRKNQLQETLIQGSRAKISKMLTMYACMGQIDLSTLVNDTSQVSVMYEGMRQIDLDKRYQVSVTFVQFTKVRTNKVWNR